MLRRATTSFLRPFVEDQARRAPWTRLLIPLLALLLACSSDPAGGADGTGGTAPVDGGIGGTPPVDGGGGGGQVDGGPTPDDSRPPSLVSLRAVDAQTIELQFDQPVHGTNIGFTLYNTTDAVFDAVIGFGTATLTATLAHPMVYGEPVNVSYLDIETKGQISGDLHGSPGNLVRYFLKERVDTSVLTHEGAEKYVSATATGGGDGTLAAPYTLSEMVAELSPGTRYNVAAGDYGSASLVISNVQGAPGSPIIIEGYRQSAGDSPDLGWDYGTNTAMDPAVMPLLDGGGSTSSAITLAGDSAYVTIKNFQLRNYPGTLLYSNQCHDLWFDNVIAENGNRAIQSVGDPDRSYHNVVTSCVAYNGWLHNFQIRGVATLVEGNRSYCDDDGDATDYYYGLAGHENVLRGNYAHRVGDLAHYGHALSIATPSTVSDDPDPNSVEYNFVDGHTSVNIVKAVELRHGGVRYNVVRGVESYGEGPGADSASGVMFRDNASFNIIENAHVHEAGAGIYFVESVEIGVGLGHDNIVRNSVFENNRMGIYVDNHKPNGADGFNNKIVNNTFYNTPTLFRIYADGTNVTACEFENNIVQGSTNLTAGYAFQGWSFDHNAFWDNDASGFPVPSGTDNVELDPGFVDAAAGDFHLQSSSPGPVRNGGADLAEVPLDHDGLHRRSGEYSMGAFED